MSPILTSLDLETDVRPDHDLKRRHYLVGRDLDVLFPAPSLPPSPLCPQRLPGTSTESLAALQHVLRDNHSRFHIFYNHLKFQNHITYRAMVLYALGGSPSAIMAGYDQDCADQRLAFASPSPVTVDNFRDHLGDENYYQAYLTFFDQEITAKGISYTLEKYVFSEAYNLYSSPLRTKQPEMLSRFLAGLLHALIHIGYGLEFGLKGLICEGLAMATVHDLVGEDFFLPSFFAAETPPFNGEEAMPANGTPAAEKQTRNTHALDIVALALADPRWRTGGTQRFAKEIRSDVAKNGRILREHIARWTVDITCPGEIDRKIEELIWMVCVIFAVGGWRGPTPGGNEGREDFVADFFVMHMITSSLFLHSLIPHLTVRTQAQLLRAYMLVVLSWWLVRAPPSLDIRSFMKMTPTTLYDAMFVDNVGCSAASPISPTTPDSFSEVLNRPPATAPNPFLYILQTALAHPNDHLPKLQRALVHYNTLYGTRPTGCVPGLREDGTGLAGAELLDGSLFLRAALLTARYMGWVCEGDTAKRFSTGGFVDYV